MLLKWRPPRWVYGSVALLTFGAGWLFVLPDRDPEVDFQFWALIAWYLVTLFFALIGWPSWPTLVALVLVAFSLSIYADSLVTSYQFHFALWVLASVGCILVLRRKRDAASLLLVIGCIGGAIANGLNAFRTKEIILDGFAWKPWWLEWVAKISGFSMVCLPIALVLFIRGTNAPASGETKKSWRIFKRGMSVLLGAVIALLILYVVSQREGLMNTLRATRMAHQMSGWTELRSKYSAPFATLDQMIGFDGLRIGVSSKHPDVLDSATWLVAVRDGKPIENWNTFDQEFTRASQAISRERWLADWKRLRHGRSVELWVQGDRSHAILKSNETLMKHVWQQFGLKGTPRFYVLARRTGYSTIDFAFNEDGSEAVAEESAERKRSELSPHWLDHLRYRNWGKDGVFNNEFTVIDADGQWQSRMYTRGTAQMDEENKLY